MNPVERYCAIVSACMAEAGLKQPNWLLEHGRLILAVPFPIPDLTAWGEGIQRALQLADQADTGTAISYMWPMNVGPYLQTVNDYYSGR